MHAMKIALAQVNPTVGDLEGNRRLVEEAADKAAAAGGRMPQPEEARPSYSGVHAAIKRSVEEETVRRYKAELEAEDGHLHLQITEGEPWSFGKLPRKAGVDQR